MEKWCTYIHISPGLEGWRRRTPFNLTRNLTFRTGTCPIQPFWTKTNPNPLKRHLSTLKRMKTTNQRKREQLAKEIGFTTEDAHTIEYLSSKFRTTGILNIAIEGNIASGKSSFISKLHLEPHAETILEPLEKWTNNGGINLLQLAYTHPEKYSFAFQMLVLVTMLQGHTKQHNRPIKIMERSFETAHNCFATLLADLGFITREEFGVIKSWATTIEENNMTNIDLTVYLRTTPDIAFTRLTKRDRKEERNVSLTYLEKLHGLHEEWAAEYQIPLVTLDCNGNENQLTENVIFFEKLVRFIIGDY